MRNRPLLVGLGVLALAGSAVVAPVVATTSSTIKVTPEPVVKYVQSPSAIAGQKCLATPRLLVKTKPAPKKLPDGLTMRIWDTGPVKDQRLAMKAIRVVSVRVPNGAPAGAMLVAAPDLSTAQTPTSQITRRTNVLAAVNGAIFNLRTGATPDGPQLIGGSIQKAVTAWSDTLNFDKYGRITAGKLRLVSSGLLSVPTLPGESTNLPLRVTALNNQDLTTGLNLYTNVWGSNVAHPAGSHEVWLKGSVQRVGTSLQFVGQVDSLHESDLGGRPAATTKAGVATWVLTSRPEDDSMLLPFMVGQPVQLTVDYQTSDRSGRLTTGVVGAMGRGGVYVAGGSNRANCNRGNEELRPRTLIGWNTKTGDTWFVTVQGKYQRWGVRWGGASVHQAADYLISLGADTAVALDGGGSTTMVIRTKIGGTVLHVDRSNPKDGQRPVVNVIAAVPMSAVKPSPVPLATPKP